jgi:serine/threonine protein kinase
MAELNNVSLDFAAPEVVRALEAGKTQMKVEPSQDVWALGMVAYELLTRSRAFPSGMAQQVRCSTPFSFHFNYLLVGLLAHQMHALPVTVKESRFILVCC